MAHVTSSVTELPRSCKSAAERVSEYLKEEDRYADLTEEDCNKLTALERELSESTGESVSLIAYRLS